MKVSNSNACPVLAVNCCDAYTCIQHLIFLCFHTDEFKQKGWSASNMVFRTPYVSINFLRCLLLSALISFPSPIHSCSWPVANHQESVDFNTTNALICGKQDNQYQGFLPWLGYVSFMQLCKYTSAEDQLLLLYLRQPKSLLWMQAHCKSLM